LYIFFPGEYIVGAVLFLVSLAVLQRDIHYIQQQQSKSAALPQPSTSYGSAVTLATDE
jgi:hypothetical protein